MRVLITGANGRIGAAVAARLRQRHQVVGFDCNAGPQVDIQGDLRDAGLVMRLCAGIDAVVHTAALHAPHVGRAPEAMFRQINVVGTGNLLAACRAHGVRRVVYTSSTSVYGAALRPSDRAVWVTESLQPRPRDIYDETKLAAERLCAEFAREGATAVVLRMSRCFPEAPERMAWYRLYRGVDRRDVAQAHRLALEKPLAGFQVFNVSAPTPFQAEDTKRLLAAADRLVAARLPDFVDAFHQRGWPLPRSIDRVYVIDRACRVLGYRPAYDFRQMLGVDLSHQ